VFKYSFSCFKLAKLLGKKYTVDDADYFWSSKKITEFKKKILKLSHLFFSRYTCFLLLGMFQFNIWMWEMSWENEFKNNTAIQDK
jgi:hypothetical protein